MTALTIRVSGVSSLEPGEARVFRFRRGKHLIEGFVLRTLMGYVAFANECPHWHVDLDLGDGNFWDADSERIVCKNHSALFNPESGVCEVGPCVGMSLEAFAFELDGDGDGASVSVPNAEPAEPLESAS